MNLSGLRLLAIFNAALVLSSCTKKPAPVAETPAAEAPAADSSAAKKRHDPLAVRDFPEAEQKPASTPVADDPATANVPAELLASDNAYEAWFKKYDLDLNDPKMLDADPDGDGATNREEFMADTNPRDPNSRPGIHKVMRLKQYTEVRVPLVLESTDGRSAKIRRTEGEAKTETVAPGQTIDGYKVGKLVVRHDTDKDGHPVDLSRVELEEPATKQKLVLVKDMTVKSASSSAVLTAADGTTLKVRQGETFQWPTEQGATYKVIDLRPDQVVVQQVENKKMWTIPRE